MNTGIDWAALPETPGENRPEDGLSAAEKWAFSLESPRDDEEARAAAYVINRTFTGRSDPFGRLYAGGNEAGLTGMEYFAKMRGLARTGDPESLWSDEAKEYRALKTDREKLDWADAHWRKRAADYADKAFDAAVPTTRAITKEEADSLGDVFEAPDRAALDDWLRDDAGKYERMLESGNGRDDSPMPDLSDPATLRRQREDAAEADRLERRYGEMSALKKKYEKDLAKARIRRKYEQKLLDDNQWAVYLGIKDAMTPGERKVVDLAIAKGGAPKNWMGGALDPELEQAFLGLTTREQGNVAPLIRMNSVSRDSTLVGDATRGFLRVLGDTAGDALVGAESYLRRASVSGANYQDAVERRAYLREANEGRMKDWGVAAEAVIGAVSTVPYMAAAAIPYAGLPVVMLSAGEQFEREAAAQGADVSGTDWQLAKFGFSAAYAAVERLQFAGAFGKVADPARRMLYAEAFHRMNAVTRSAWAQLAAGTLKGTIEESLQEGFQRSLEEMCIAHGTGGDMAREAVQGFTEDFVQSLGTMGVVSLLGQGAKAARHRERPLGTEEVAAFELKLKAIRDLVDGGTSGRNAELAEMGEAAGPVLRAWRRAAATGSEHARRVALGAFGVAGDAAAHWDGFLMDIEQRIGDDREALQSFYGTRRVATRQDIREAGGAVERVEEDGTRILTVAAPGGRGAFTVALGARMGIDPDNEADATDIVNALNKGGMDITLESWLGRDADGNPVENALTAEEKGAILSDPKWGFHKRGGIVLRSAGGEAVDGRMLAFVNGEIAVNDVETSGGDVLTTTVLHEQMHGVMRILRDSAKAGNKEAKALLDKIEKTFGGADGATEEQIADAFERFALNRKDIAGADGLWERFVAFVRELFGMAESAAEERKATDRTVNEFFEIAAGGNVDEAIARDESAKRDVPSTSDERSSKEDIRYSISGLYTGSAADYAERVPVLDKDGNITGYRIDNAPSLQYVGTGEGNQVYGWGLYASDVRGVAEGYAAKMVKSKHNRPSVKINGKEYVQGRYDETIEPWMQVFLNHAFSATAWMRSKDFRKKLLASARQSLKLAEKGAKSDPETFGEMVEANKKCIDFISDSKNKIEFHDNAIIYEQTFFTDRAPGDESHLLKWHKPVSREQMRWVVDEARAEGVYDRLAYVFNLKKQWGGDLYENIAKHLGPRGTSEFLARAGIDGVKYPVDSWGGKGVKDGDKAGWNYVSFRDDNIRVDHKWVDGVQKYSIRASKKFSGIDLATAFAVRDAINGIDRDAKEYDRLLNALGVKREGPDPIDGEKLKKSGKDVLAGITANAASHGRAVVADAMTPLSTLAAAAQAARLDQILGTVLRGTYVSGLRTGAYAGEEAQKAVMAALTARMRAAHGYDARALDEMLNAPAPELVVQVREAIFSGAAEPGTPRKTEFDELREQVSPEDQALMDAATGIDPEEEPDELAKALAKIGNDKARLAAAKRASDIAQMRDKVRERLAELLKRQEERAKRAAERRARKEQENADGGDATGVEDVPDSKIAGDDAGNDDSAESAAVDPESVKEMLSALGADGIDLRTSGQMAAFVRAFVETAIARDAGVPLSKMTKKAVRTALRDPLAMQKFRRTAVGYLRALSDALLDPTEDSAAKWVERRLADIPDAATPRQVQRAIQDVSGFIQRRGLVQSRRALVSEIIRDVKRTAIRGAKFDPMERDLERKVAARAEQDARYLVRVLKMSAGEVLKEQEALANVAEWRRMNGAEGETAETADDETLEKCLRRQAILQNYGGLKYRMPAEIAAAGADIRRRFADEAMAVARRAEERKARLDALAQALALAADHVRETRGDGFDAAPSGMEKFLDELTATVRQRLEYMTGANPEAKPAVDEVMRMLNDGSRRLRLVQQEYRRQDDALLERSAKAGGRTLRQLLRELSEPVPEELSRALATEEQNRTLSWGQALQLLVSVEQMATYYDNVATHGREGHAALIRAAMADRPHFQALVDNLRGLYATRREELSGAFESVTGLPILSPDPLYMPVKMLAAPREGLDATVKSWSPFSAALTPRRKNNLDFDTSADILTMLADRERDAAKSIAFGAAGLDLRSVLGREQTQRAFIRARGKEFNRRLLEQVTDTLNDGYAMPGNFFVRLMQSLGTISTYAALSWNAVTMLKQMTSVPAWTAVMEGGYKELWTCLCEAAGNADARREFIDSEGFRARYGTTGGGFTAFGELIREAFADGRTPGWKRFHVAGMTAVQFGDFIPTFLVGPGVYMARKRALMRMGMEEGAARERACRDAWALVEECQQSDLKENTPDILRRQGVVARQMLKFATSPLLQTSHEAHAWRMWRDAAARGEEEEATRWRARFANQIVSNHVLMPAAMYLAELGVKALLGSEPPEREEWIGTLAAQMLVGPLSRVFLLGAVLDGVANWAVSGAGGKPKTPPQTGMAAGVQIANYWMEDGKRLASDFAMHDFASFRDDFVRMVGRGVRPVSYAAQAAQNWSGYDPTKERAKRRRKAKKRRDAGG